MWADTLLAAERDLLLRFGLWGAVSLSAGVALLILLRRRRGASPVVTHFAVQTAVWGTLAVGLALVGWRRADLRDYESARRLYEVLGGFVGLDLGMVLIGATLIVAGWVLGRRLGAVGAGAGILVQGIAWLVLHAGFTTFLRGAL